MNADKKNAKNKHGVIGVYLRSSAAGFSCFRGLNIPYMIAVGGAGSFGYPAFFIGIRISAHAIRAITTSPARYDGYLNTSGKGQSSNLKVAQTSPASDSPAISPDATSTPTFSTRALCASLQPARWRIESVIQRMMPPTKIAEVVAIGRYIPMATSMGLFTLNMIIAKPIRIPAITRGHAMSPPTI